MSRRPAGARTAPRGRGRGGETAAATRGVAPDGVGIVALGAAVAAVATRMPFAARRMWDHDSIQFALAVGDFDLAAHQPHPPGYPLYVGLLKLLAAAGVAPVDAMVALSIAAAAAGAGFAVLLVARLAAEGGAGERAAAGAGLLAAALYVFDPLLWFYGELPLVYAVEGGLTVVLAWAALRMADGRGAFVTACALYGLAGGVRPSTAVLLAPLFLYGLWRAWRGRAGPEGRRPSAGTVALGAAVGAACVLAWLVPLAAAAGGLAAYRRLSGEHFAVLLPETSVLYGAGWPALAHNLEVLTKWAVQGLVPAVAAVAAAWALAPAPRRRAVAAGLRLAASRAPFLAVWALPPIAFFALFHVTKAGYTLIHLPALLAAAALAAAPALAPAGARGSWRAPAAAGVAAAVGACLFLLGADRRPDQPRWLAAVRHEHNAGALAAYERDLDALRAALARFPPSETALATVELSGTGGAGAEGFLYPYHRHLQWYAPDYPVALLVPEAGFAEISPGGREPFRRVADRVELPAGTRRVVFILAGPTGDRLRLPLAEVVLANGTFLVLAAPLGEAMEVGPLTLTPAEEPVRRPARRGRAG